MHQVLIKIFSVGKGIVGCKFESRQTWLKCRSGGKTEAWRNLSEIQRKKKSKEGVADLEGKLGSFGEKQPLQRPDSWTGSNPDFCL